MNKTQNHLYTPINHLQRHPRVGELTRHTKIGLMLFLHIPLAFLLSNVQLFATVHAFITLLIGVWIALTSDDIRKVVPVVAYITGAEVLWRMTKANIFWEYGKYATVAILLIALLKHRKIEKAALPAIYFILLLPSAIITINTLGLSSNTQSAISFNLSGPLAAMMCMVYFRQIKTDTSELGSMMWWAVYPIVSLLTLATYSTLTATAIEFGSESIFVTSGGFGPNQVSAILGLGAMLLIMLAIHEEKLATRNLALLLSIVLLTQSVLTFSRGGVLNVLIAIPLAFLHLLGSPNKLMKGIFALLIIFLVAYFLLLPELEQFTGGALEARFTDISLTGREEIARADIELWFKNPVLGVGPGLSSSQRLFMQGTAAHTEYSRILAEHGSFGLFSFVILALLLIIAYFKAPDAYARAWVVAIAAWPLLEMVHAAMRVVSISFMLGLALIGWRKTEEMTDEEEKLKLKPRLSNVKRKYRT